MSQNSGFDELAENPLDALEFSEKPERQNLATTPNKADNLAQEDTDPVAKNVAEHEKEGRYAQHGRVSLAKSKNDNRKKSNAQMFGLGRIGKGVRNLAHGRLPWHGKNHGKHNSQNNQYGNNQTQYAANPQNPINSSAPPMGMGYPSPQMGNGMPNPQMMNGMSAGTPPQYGPYQPQRMLGGMPPQYGSYPPQNMQNGMYPPQNSMSGGIPPQNGMYPPQNGMPGGMPPQNGAYPPQNGMSGGMPPRYN